MDIVYLLRDGENHELRYSLRSLVHVPHGTVWAYGGAPVWLRNVAHVRRDHAATKYQTTSEHLRAACLNESVSDPFVLMNDDFFLMKPMKKILDYNRGKVRDVIEEFEGREVSSRYVKGMRQTLELLENAGHSDPLSFELHVPLVVYKAAMLEALDLGRDLPVFHKRTAYGAIAGLKGRRISDVKVRDVRDEIPTGQFMSCMDSSFQLVRPVLARAFPDKSEYEA